MSQVSLSKLSHGRTVTKRIISIARSAAFPTFSPNLHAHNRLIIVCRAFSTPGTMQVSQIKDYINRTMLYMDKKKTEPELTTRNMLNQCESASEVLLLFQRQSDIGQLLDTDAIFYLHKVFRLLRQESQTMDSDQTEDATLLYSEAINNPNFHSLIKKLLLLTPYMPSTDLVIFFNILATLGIPASTNTVNFITSTIMKRINDFFPKDTILCHLGIQQYQVETANMRAIEKALLLHAENLMVEPKFFFTGLKDAKLYHVLKFLKYYRGRASKTLNFRLLESCADIVSEYDKKGRPIDLRSSIDLLHALAYTPIVRVNQHLLHSAQSTISTADLSEKQNIMVSQLLDVIDDKMADLRYLKEGNKSTSIYTKSETNTDSVSDLDQR